MPIDPTTQAYIDQIGILKALREEDAKRIAELLAVITDNTKRIAELTSTNAKLEQRLAVAEMNRPNATDEG